MTPPRPHLLSAPARLALGLLLLAAVAVLAWFAHVRELIAVSLDGEALAGALAHLRGTPHAGLMVMLVFCLLALAGAPQFLLIFATVFVFGSVLGSVYSWIATMVSAVLGYALGYLLGAEALARWGGERVNRARAAVARRGRTWSALIRLVPSGPFVLVNVLAGVAHVRAVDFVVGTALGIVPKIGLIALITAGVVDFIEVRDARSLALILGGLAAWIGLGLVLRERLRRP